MMLDIYLPNNRMEQTNLRRLRFAAHARRSAKDCICSLNTLLKN